MTVSLSPVVVAVVITAVATFGLTYWLMLQRRYLHVGRTMTWLGATETGQNYYFTELWEDLSDDAPAEPNHNLAATADYLNP